MSLGVNEKRFYVAFNSLIIVTRIVKALGLPLKIKSKLQQNSRIRPLTCPKHSIYA